MRKFNKDSLTWKTFERVLMDRAPDLEDEYLGLMSRGAAINLAMQLNAAQSQWQIEQCLPNGMILYSAKAKPFDGDDWTVEISRNNRKQGRSGESTAIMQQLAYATQPADTTPTAHAQHSADPDSRPMTKQELYDWFIDLNRKSLDVTGYPYVPGPLMAAAVEEIRAQKETYLTRLMSQPAEPGYTPTPEETAAWEAERAERKAKIAAVKVADDEIWTCPGCGLPQVGSKTSSVYWKEDTPTRLCNDCKPENIAAPRNILDA